MAEPAESYLQRAELLADLGRYGEAAAELADAPPEDVAAQTLLARIRLADGDPRRALAAADAAVAAAPGDVAAMVARGMALADLGRVDEAAAQAERILKRGRGDGYACSSAAAILAEVRNGQVALDAAWEGVRLMPDQPRAHLVLGVVAARLGLDTVAARAYREALALDPKLAVAQSALGVARTEQHRYAAALSRYGDSAGAEGDGAAAPPDQVRRGIWYGAGFALVTPLLVGLAQGYGLAGPLVATVVGTAVLGLLWWLWRRLPDPVRADLPARLRASRSLTVAVWAVLAAPALLFLYTLFAAGWLLAAVVVTGAVALIAARPRA